MSSFEDKLKKGLNLYGLEINAEQIDRFKSFYLLLKEWNQKINLTSIEEENEVIIKHFLDSLLPVKFSNPINWGKTIDLGTGGGFPGIPLKIVFPDLNITLFDSTQKKITFVNLVIEELGLKDAIGLHGRAEEFGNDKNYRENFDIVVSRAVAPLNILVEYCLPFLKKNGKMIAYKSQDIREEFEQSRSAIVKLGGTMENISSEMVPLSEIKRSLIIISKTKKTPSMYPRRAGIPKKKPLM